MNTIPNQTVLIPAHVAPEDMVTHSVLSALFLIQELKDICDWLVIGRECNPSISESLLFFFSSCLLVTDDPSVVRILNSQSPDCRAFTFYFVQFYQGPNNASDAEDVIKIKLRKPVLFDVSIKCYKNDLQSVNNS